MEKLTFSFFLVAVLLSTSAAQVVAPFPHRVQLDSKIANTLLIHKEEPACQKDSDGIKVTGTVVIAITIDKDGHVTHTQTLSGPKMLRPLALTTVRKYLYKPYLLNGTPVEVETTVSIRIDCICHNGQA
ncbi:MAG: energy transducer TonB [Terracidiphilus sp.]